MLCKKLVLNITKGYDKIPTLLGPHPQLSTHPGKQYSEAKKINFLIPFPPEETQKISISNIVFTQT